MLARQSFVVEMIEGREDLSNAATLNSSMVTAVRLLEPSMAGAGEGYCFLMDGISYIAVIVSLLVLKIIPRGASRYRAQRCGRICAKAGVWGAFRTIRSVLIATRDGEFGGNALHRADANFCRQCAARRAAYAGVSDGRVGSWGARHGSLLATRCDFRRGLY